MIIKVSKKKNLFVENVQQSQLGVECKNVLNMGKILLSLNVSSVVKLPNGSVGVTHISASLAIKDNALVTMFQERLKISYLNAKVLRNAL
jgi:hypothetical protein